MPHKKTKKKVKARVGDNLPSVLSRTLVKDWYNAISELVCNAYDADAEEVHIDLSSKLETLVIQDDGEGMDQKGLGNFFRLGDSSKIEEPISLKKKRKRIGRYGIAKVLLQYLGRSFKVESVKEGTLYCVDEGVSKRRVRGHKHQVAKDTPEGTKITIHDLKFDVGSGKGQFDVKKLQSRLQWDIPNKPDFNVYVNGQLVKKRGVVEYARVYKVHERIGRHFLKGRIYWRKGGQRDLEGIRIYVNGRAVGDPSMFDLKRIAWSFEGRTLGEIHADFLEDIVTLDRSDFQEDPRLDKVKDRINRILRTVKEDIAEGRGRRAFYEDQRLYEHVREALGLAEEQLNKRVGNGKYFILEFAPQERSGSLSKLDQETNTIYLNPKNRMFAFLTKGKGLIGRKVSEVYLKRAFLIASAYALSSNGECNDALSQLIEEQTAILFRRLPSISNSVSRFMEGTVLTPLRDIYLNKYRLYDHQELSHLTGRFPFVIRLLHTCGALKGSENHLFDKSAIFSVLKQVEGHISCIEAVDKRYASPNVDMRILYDNPKPTSLDVALSDSSREKAIQELGVVNVGKKHPMYFVPLERADEFAMYVKKGGFYNGD